MIEVAAAVLADDVEVAVEVHREPLVLLGRHVERVAGIGLNRQRVVDVTGAIDMEDPAGFLAEHQQMARLRPSQRRQVRQREHVREIERLISAGSNRLVEFSVVGEPLVAVPAAKSMPVWKIPCGCASLTR